MKSAQLVVVIPISPLLVKMNVPVTLKTTSPTAGAIVARRMGGRNGTRHARKSKSIAHRVHQLEEKVAVSRAVKIIGQSD